MPCPLSTATTRPLILPGGTFELSLAACERGIRFCGRCPYATKGKVKSRIQPTKNLLQDTNRHNHPIVTLNTVGIPKLRTHNPLGCTGSPQGFFYLQKS